jgi:F0F1-type ATP synthase assembly protein I
MKLDLNLFNDALYPQSSSQWAGETNGIFGLGISLLRDLNSDQMTREQEQEFYAIAIGTIIAGIAYNKDKYFNTDYTWISKNPDDKYYQVPHYPLHWGQLYRACGIDEILKTWPKPYPENVITQKNPVFLNMVKVSGAKILSGELFFDKEQMTAIFPKLENFFNKIESERRREYLQIETLFDQALEHQVNANLSHNKKDFLATVAQLKVHTMQQFQAGHKEFDVDKCLSLAQRTKDLTDNLMNNKATQEQIDQFIQDNKIFKGHSNSVKILTTILATLVGMAAGIMVGFLIAGPVGAVVGVIAGGASAAVLTLGVFALKKDSVEKVGADARKLIADDQSDYSTVTKHVGL